MANTTFGQTVLSASTDGRNVKVAQTATPGTTIHTAQSDATLVDQVFLYATNTDTTDRKLTVEFGGTTSPDDLHEVTIPAESGPVLVIPGFPLRNGLVVKAFAAVSNVLNINGYVLRASA